MILVGTGTLDASGRVDVNFIRTGNVTRTDPTVPVALPYSAANPMPSRLFYTPAAPLPVEIAAVKQDRRVGAGAHERGGRAAQEEARRPLTGR